MNSNLTGGWSTNALGLTVVPVCWHTAGWTTEKEWVRQTVVSQWESMSSVRFVGWGLCDVDTPTEAIRIQINESIPASFVGRTRSSPSMWLNFNFPTWSHACNDAVDDALFPGDDRAYCIRSIALREFGHALGFLPGGTSGSCTEALLPQPSGQLLTQYDPASSMSACAEWGRVTLNGSEAQGLRAVYGAPAFEFRSAGGLAESLLCTSVNEPTDPDGWKDNYLCSSGIQGLSWSSAGPLAGLRCTQILEPADPYSWDDNYLCVPPFSPLQFTWSSKGALPGQSCISWAEPSDPNTWDDNYLCYTQRIVFSSRGRIAGYDCTQMDEPSDPDGWDDNWLCSQSNEGLRWSHNGPIEGMRCSSVNEVVDPHSWYDNYICVPKTSSLNLVFSSTGPSPGKTCVQMLEPSDPNTWDDNYLCY